MPSEAPPPVCVVDDDPAALVSLCFLLESEGYPVASFRDGSDLLEMTFARQPSCYLIDVKLPGMDGLAVSRRLRELRPGVPVVLITGHPDPAIRTRADQAGLPLLEKPLSQEGILAALRTAHAGDRPLRNSPSP